MIALAPNERLSGSPQARADLLRRLATLRERPDPCQQHSNLTFAVLSDLLCQYPQILDLQVFRTGLEILACRYAALGLDHLLPLHRVWVGTHSAQRQAFGGFHYPDQGYRHLQMVSVVTIYGDLTERSARPPWLVALDLLRAYAHDCLHFGTYRRYRMWDTGPGRVIGRVQYGINFRRSDGRTYSSRDHAGDRSTRNLGIVMEGATDQEARSIAREVATREHIGQPGADSCTDYFAFRDEIGSLDDGDLRILSDRLTAAYDADARGADLFLQKMSAYARFVGERYQAFLAEVGRERREELHRLILTSMISGSLGPLARWLNRLHGPGAFAAIFRCPAYCRPRSAQDAVDEPPS